MKSAVLLLLALAVCALSIPDEEDAALLQRAESLLLRSILKKIQEEESSDGEPASSLTEWISKRQHPGKRYQEEVDKRQHPGKREEEEGEGDYSDLQKRQHPGKREEAGEGDYSDLQKRQHPGKREDEIELQTRQHPGKRSMLERFTDTPDSPATHLNELSKRQHPGKRYLVYNKRQHPGRRELEDGEDADNQGDEEKRQHPGKRLWDNRSPDLGSFDPCDIQDPAGCSKAILLLELLDNVTKSRGEEKRQHPGRRVAPEDATDQE